jgi:8-hydroxy-5-deazaflavin:NADPH oxidoreductase
VNIAIIGAGNVGTALAGSLTNAGHEVTVTARSKESAEQCAMQTGAKAVTENREAAQGGDVVVLAVPLQAVDAVINELADVLEGKVMVDTTNRVNPEDPGSTLDGTSVAERVQATLPGARVVKALNTVFSSTYANPEIGGMKIDAFAAGDDDDSKRQVLELVESIGFNPVDAGPLVLARVLEGMAALTILEQMRTGGSWSDGWKILRGGS